MNIVLLNPGIEDHEGHPSSNLGDLIIEEAVIRELSRIFCIKPLNTFSSQEYLKGEHMRTIAYSDLTFLGGTNLLSSNMNCYRQWKINLMDSLIVNGIILFGVGWWQYQAAPNLYTKLLLKSTLSHRYLHSVRDSYTEQQMKLAGFKNLLNTGCPTMWPLINLKSKDFPFTKASNVLLMLTDYAKNPDLDKKLIELLHQKYETVFVWSQGRNDLEYVSSFNKSLQILDHSLDALNTFLLSDIHFDYIGTRLHGGIKCLLAKKRSLIIEVDNRAKEIAKDTNLPTCERNNLDYILNWIDKPFLFDIKLNVQNIKAWQKQFVV